MMNFTPSENRSNESYVPLTFTAVPHELIRQHMPDLSGAELKCLLYVTDRTLGFNKVSDRVSLRQFAEGITRKDGTKLDRGTGLSRSAVKKALRGLIEKGLVGRERNSARDGGWDSSTYWLKGLNVRRVRVGQFGEPPGAPEEPTRDTGESLQDTTVQDKQDKIQMDAASPRSFSELVGGITQDSPDRLVQAAVRGLTSRLRDSGISGADGLVAEYLKHLSLQDLAELADSTLADPQARDPVALLVYRLRHGFPPT
jgi:hypothetical protein